MTDQTRYWAVIPAAGVGARMQADRPKQYLELQGQTVIEHTLKRLLSHPSISGCVVSLGENDPYWPELGISRDERVQRAAGGQERCHSVLNALELLADQADEQDWVLVHDAARPCLHHDDVDRLLAALDEHPVGGLLAVPVSDTVKRETGDAHVAETVDRTGLWRAFTPQMFRLGVLKQALTQALADGYLVTDDASAMEHAGFQPLLVEGRADNIKITRPEDLALAEWTLQRQERECE